MDMRFKSTRSAIAVMVPGALLVAVAVYAVVHHDPGATRTPGSPQAAIVESFGYSPPTFGTSCGGVAVVRLEDGSEVRAASFLRDSLKRGTRVTVAQQHASCPPAMYTVLHAGPPGVSSRRGSRATPGHGAA